MGRGGGNYGLDSRHPVFRSCFTPPAWTGRGPNEILDILMNVNFAPAISSGQLVLYRVAIIPQRRAVAFEKPLLQNCFDLVEMQ
jgi:hypothetical protein